MSDPPPWRVARFICACHRQGGVCNNAPARRLIDRLRRIIGVSTNKEPVMAKKSGVRNFVHKYSIELNRATVEVDKKKALKLGYCKHKGGKQAPFDFLAVGFA